MLSVYRGLECVLKVQCALKHGVCTEGHAQCALWVQCSPEVDTAGLQRGSGPGERLVGLVLRNLVGHGALNTMKYGISKTQH